VKVLVIEPNTPPEVRDVIDDGDALRQIVGGYLEAVHFVRGALIYIDEEAKVRADKAPVFNPFVTDLVIDLGRGLFPGDFIANTAVILGTLDDRGEYDGENHDVPQSVVDIVMNYYRKCAEGEDPAVAGTDETIRGDAT